MKTIAEQIIEFNRTLSFDYPLPEQIRVMNPFRENSFALEASSLFYQKYYDDYNPRYIVLGINPGRFGAGLTGTPFTDPKRLAEVCKIDAYRGPMAHEPSSVFVYEMIEQYGGVEAFYDKFYINSLCPLGFTTIKPNGKEVNCNYYDSRALLDATRDFIMETLQKQLQFNILTETCICLGTGKNFQYLQNLNKKHKFFKQIVPLEHPRYVIQYKTKNKQEYIDKYLNCFRAL